MNQAELEIRTFAEVGIAPTEMEQAYLLGQERAAQERAALEGYVPTSAALAAYHAALARAGITTDGLIARVDSARAVGAEKERVASGEARL